MNIDLFVVFLEKRFELAEDTIDSSFDKSRVNFTFVIDAEMHLDEEFWSPHVELDIRNIRSDVAEFVSIVGPD